MTTASFPDAVHDFGDEGGSFEPDRRQVVYRRSGCRSSRQCVGSRGRRIKAENLLDMRIIRNPARHNEFGVGIQLTVPAGKQGANSLEEKIAVALYPRVFQDLRPLSRRSLPRGERVDENGKREDAVERLEPLHISVCPRFGQKSSYSLEFVINDKEIQQSTACFRETRSRIKFRASATRRPRRFLRGKRRMGSCGRSRSSESRVVPMGHIRRADSGGRQEGCDAYPFACSRSRLLRDGLVRTGITAGAETKSRQQAMGGERLRKHQKARHPQGRG